MRPTSFSIRIVAFALLALLIAVGNWSLDSTGLAEQRFYSHFGGELLYQELNFSAVAPDTMQHATSFTLILPNYRCRLSVADLSRLWHSASSLFSVVALAADDPADHQYIWRIGDDANCAHSKCHVTVSIFSLASAGMTISNGSLARAANFLLQHVHTPFFLIDPMPGCRTSLFAHHTNFPSLEKAFASSAAVAVVAGSLISPKETVLSCFMLRLSAWTLSYNWWDGQNLQLKDDACMLCDSVGTGEDMFGSAFGPFAASTSLIGKIGGWDLVTEYNELPVQTAHFFLTLRQHGFRTVLCPSILFKVAVAPSSNKRDIAPVRYMTYDLTAPEGYRYFHPGWLPSSHPDMFPFAEYQTTWSTSVFSVQRDAGYAAVVLRHSFEKIHRADGTEHFFHCNFTAGCDRFPVSLSWAQLQIPMYTRPCCLRGLAEMLLNVSRVCDQMGVEYAIADGVLLGAMKSNSRLLAWDYDLDILVNVQRIDQLATSLVSNFSYNCGPVSYGIQCYFGRYFVPGPGVDLIFWSPPSALPDVHLDLYGKSFPVAQGNDFVQALLHDYGPSMLDPPPVRFWNAFPCCVAQHNACIYESQCSVTQTIDMWLRSLRFRYPFSLFLWAGLLVVAAGLLLAMILRLVCHSLLFKIVDECCGRGWKSYLETPCCATRDMLRALFIHMQFPLDWLFANSLWHIVKAHLNEPGTNPGDSVHLIWWYVIVGSSCLALTVWFLQTMRLPSELRLQLAPIISLPYLIASTCSFWMKLNVPSVEQPGALISSGLAGDLDNNTMDSSASVHRIRDRLQKWMLLGHVVPLLVVNRCIVSTVVFKKVQLTQDVITAWHFALCLLNLFIRASISLNVTCVALLLAVTSPYVFLLHLKQEQ